MKAIQSALHSIDHLPHEPLFNPPYAPTLKLERMQRSHAVSRAHVEASVGQRLAFTFLFRGEHSSVPLNTQARRRLAAWALKEGLLEPVQPSMMATIVAEAFTLANQAPEADREATFEHALKTRMDACLDEAKAEYARRLEAIRQQTEFEVIVQRTKELTKRIRDEEKASREAKVSQ